MVVLRRVLASLDAVEAMALVIEKMRQTASNAEFLQAMTNSD